MVGLKTRVQCPRRFLRRSKTPANGQGSNSLPKECLIPKDSVKSNCGRYVLVGCVGAFRHRLFDRYISTASQGVLVHPLSVFISGV